MYIFVVRLPVQSILGGKVISPLDQLAVNTTNESCGQPRPNLTDCMYLVRRLLGAFLLADTQYLLKVTDK